MKARHFQAISGLTSYCGLY